METPAATNRSVAAFGSVGMARMLESMRVAQMVARLPEAIYDPGVDPLLQQAAVECFFAHVRSLIEFLKVKPSDSRDFNAGDILSGWAPSVDAAKQARLTNDWLNASRQVMHFSKERVRSEIGPATAVPIDRASLDRMADDVLSVWDDYATQLNHPASAKRADSPSETPAMAEPQPVDRAGYRPIRGRLREVSRVQLSTCPHFSAIGNQPSRIGSGWRVRAADMPVGPPAQPGHADCVAAARMRRRS
ncbi:hypothetical protein [Nocardia fusca]|uniref:hypothetical protein n=1 Tax=Nocardia fusca TaxID=941183 RepID=UPI000A4C0100|nr:hypothetical protein [Nocardia fusca]